MLSVVILSLTDAHLVRLRVESTRIASRHSVARHHIATQCSDEARVCWGRVHKSNKYNICMFVRTYVCMHACMLHMNLIKLVNARLALCLASDGVVSLPIRVTMVALRSNSFCQSNAGPQETDSRLLFYRILRSIIRFRRSIIRCLRLLCN